MENQARSAGHLLNVRHAGLCLTDLHAAEILCLLLTQNCFEEVERTTFPMAEVQGDC